jgi:hypothetical protein
MTLLLLTTTSCGITAETATPGCGSVERLALVAQSVPDAAYLPCLQELPQGWRATAFDASRGSTRMALRSDRGGDEAVEVVLQARCDVAGASPAAPRAEGVRSYLRLRSVSGTYAGTMYDVFPGGCVRYRFAFPRGPHIPLMEELAAAVHHERRGDVRLDLLHRHVQELDP